MDVNETEQEQIESLKKWWRENGKAASAGVVIGLAVVFAGWSWRDYGKTQTAAASVEYRQLIEELEQDQQDAALQRAARIQEQYARTPYAVLAALARAKIKVEQGDTAAAGQYLRWALDNAAQPELEHIARLRLARVMLERDEKSAALKLIEPVKSEAFAAQYEELRGDIYLALNQPAAARTGYQRALALLAPDSGQTALLRMKLDDLGTSAGAQDTAP